MQDINWVALTVFVLLFGFITWLGFAAAHWRRGDLDQLHEWGLGGRRFGTVIARTPFSSEAFRRSTSAPSGSVKLRVKEP